MMILLGLQGGVLSWKAREGRNKGEKELDRIENWERGGLGVKGNCMASTLKRPFEDGLGVG
jgi:hypothetical protein